MAVNSTHMDAVNRDRIARRSLLRNVIGPRSAFGFCTESVVLARPAAAAIISELYSTPMAIETGP